MKILRHSKYNTLHHKPSGSGFRNTWGGSTLLHELSYAQSQFKFPWNNRYNTTAHRQIREEEFASGSESQAFWLGHATVLVQDHGLNMITDPVFCKRVSPFTFAGPERKVPLPLKVSGLPRIDVVLISHNHYDHLDKEAVIAINRRDKPAFFVPLGVKQLLLSWGIGNIIELDWWQYVEYNSLKLHCLPAKHFSGRWLNDRDDTLWASWMYESNHNLIYFAGDSAYANHFYEISDTLGPPGYALMPIGAYQPRGVMREVHVDPKEAVQAFLDMSAENFFAIHWGTYNLAMEPFDEPPRLLHEFTEARGIKSERVHTLAVGGSIPLF